VYLPLCVLGVALAPTWFASGILAGPVCTLYLLPPSEPDDEPGLSRWLRRWPGRLLLALLPLAGTALFLAVSLPYTAAAIMHLPHDGAKTALQSFHPLQGLRYTLWSVAENLFLGLAGISRVHVPFWATCLAWPALAAAGLWWWWGAPAGRRLMLVGLGLVF